MAYVKKGSRKVKSIISKVVWQAALWVSRRTTEYKRSRPIRRFAVKISLILKDIEWVDKRTVQGVDSGEFTSLGLVDAVLQQMVAKHKGRVDVVEPLCVGL